MNRLYPPPPRSPLPNCSFGVDVPAAAVPAADKMRGVERGNCGAGGEEVFN